MVLHSGTLFGPGFRHIVQALPDTSWLQGMSGYGPGQAQMCGPADTSAGQDSVGQHIGEHSGRDGRIEPASAEYSGESPILHVARESVHRRTLALDQVTSGPEFGIEIDMVESTVDGAALDPFRLQLSPEYLTRKVTALLAGGDPVNRERRVVDQAHLLKSIEYGINRGLGHFLGLECLVKLLSSASPGSQLAQCDGACHRLNIGIKILGSWRWLP
jgi:hypothetical protein